MDYILGRQEKNVCSGYIIN